MVVFLFLKKFLGCLHLSLVSSLGHEFWNTLYII